VTGHGAGQTGPAAGRRRLILFTSQDIGFQLVELLAERADLSFIVVTHRTRRDEVYGYRSAIDACRSHDIPCLVTPRVDEPVKARVGEFAPHLLLCAYYPYVIPQDIIRAVPLGAVNIHPGILPRYRGKYPTPWYILNGEKTYGLAIHKIDEAIDTGDVLVQACYPLPPTITGHELYRETMDRGSRLIAEHLDRLLDGSLPAMPQQGAGSYYNAIEKRYQIDWNRPSSDIERRIRVHARPFLPAHTFAFNRTVYVNRAEVFDHPGYRAQGGGIILQSDIPGSLVVSCADGCLRLTDFDVYPPLSEQEAAIHFAAGTRFE
jgi:methionyl-tRNA formyltransferase